MALHPDFSLDDTAAREFAFFNPESTLNTTHVMLAGDAGEAKPFVERRKNPADVLRQAIEREPERSDLRLKLLELYYTAAAQNRRAFLEGVRRRSPRMTNWWPPRMTGRRSRTWDAPSPRTTSCFRTG